MRRVIPLSDIPLVLIFSSNSARKQRGACLSSQMIASHVCACAFCGTLAARPLTASFLSAVLSLVPVAALWLGWESAGCLQAAFPCLSPPEHDTK